MQAIRIVNQVMNTLFTFGNPKSSSFRGSSEEVRFCQVILRGEEQALEDMPWLCMASEGKDWATRKRSLTQYTGGSFFAGVGGFDVAMRKVCSLAICTWRVANMLALSCMRYCM
jgi:hypothetical protein